MAMGQQFERRLRLTLLIFVLAAVAFLSAVTTIRIAIRGRIVAMPNLVGQSATAAGKTLIAKGLQLRVADRVYSPLPLNAVVRQSPLPGEQMKVSQDAHVVLSLGPQTVTIPPLEGHTMRSARIALLQAGLQLGEVSTIYLPSTEPDTVLKQDPPEGSSASSPRVDLLVAEGDRPAVFVMPAVTGLEQQEADRVLASAGLHVTKVTHATQAGSPTPKNMVIAQTPSRGERVATDTAIELTITD
jgi:beta-lactam-binding protein with PASTA domain